jgi:hypothetical protein
LKENEIKTERGDKIEILYKNETLKEDDKVLFTLVNHNSVNSNEKRNSVTLSKKDLLNLIESFKKLTG